jgi:type II secretory pathway pseudopilin PulG
MTAQFKPGFTIIETVLFLAVTGLLIIGVLAGVGTSINTQRYHDSVQSLQSILQDQYSEVLSVRNEKPAATMQCDSNATVTPSASGDSRGQADCVLLGQYISTTANPSQLSIARVIGNAGSASMTSSSDLTNLQQYRLNTIPSLNQTYAIEWGAQLVKPITRGPAAFSILIVRSPTSGIVRTFIDASTSVPVRNLSTLVTNAHLVEEARICVDATGLFGSNNSGVLIKAGATSGSGVETLAEGNSGC